MNKKMQYNVAGIKWHRFVLYETRGILNVRLLFSDWSK